ncbi:DUF397 domain-containing protein [Kitasatospora sp. NBC_01250]|uniref:DUF397 domain-containing protein n=1 Tax=unclassified Kitasatospora TaxID=2633591 RepID=UPI002E0DBBB1|nr:MULTISPECIES: DUF397 domain-containing protein [unclassified Kitasatospora]WSJ67385.1 DUF397 domain-containing protein [Kitasatospora sp. NBC_01302]
MHTTPAEPHWITSRHSDNGGNCVEVATNVPDAAPVRDSKNPAGPALIFPSVAFASFVAGVKSGQFDNS